MSKRKRVSKSSTGADQPAGDEGPAGEAPKEDMAHVSRDLLAGSPDIFAPKWTEESPTPAPTSEVVAEPAAAESASEPVETV